MNNMYDILEKMNLLESKGAKPDFLDIDKDGDRREPMKKAAKEVDESVEEGSTGDYSAKKARAGKDIGKPGKQFAKIAKSAAERYGSKERGEKVAGAVLAKLRAKESIDEGDVEEGNDFTGARLAAIKAGKPTFKVDGKTYRVTGDTSDEKRMDEGFADFFDKKQMYKKIGADVEGRSDDYIVTFKDGTRKRYQEVDGRRRVTSLEPVDRNDAVDDAGEVVRRGRGRPKGTGRKMGARGQTRVAETELDEDYDKDEYDEEGEMAKSFLHTIEDAAEELQGILSDDENLPEWVQKKITLAKEYVDTARDYLKANRPEMEDGEEEIMAEKAVSKAQRAAAGIAYAAKKGDIPKSELRGASKEMAKMPSGELKKFAKTKEKGLPEKVKEEDKEEVEETTTAGSVATAPSSGKTKGIFGKGVYEGAIAESFENKLQTVLAEGMDVNMSANQDGKKSLTVSATDDDAAALSDLLKMAGLFSADGYKKTCPMCGQMHEGEECMEQVEEDYANSAEDTETMSTDYMVNKISGGLNGPKLQVNPNNMADNPLAMKNLGSKGASGQLNLGAMAEGIKAEAENRLWELYQRYDTK
jgi:hypothetical protein